MLNPTTKIMFVPIFLISLFIAAVFFGIVFTLRRTTGDLSGPMIMNRWKFDSTDGIILASLLGITILTSIIIVSVARKCNLGKKCKSQDPFSDSMFIISMSDDQMHSTDPSMDPFEGVPVSPPSNTNSNSNLFKKSQGTPQSSPWEQISMNGFLQSSASPSAPPPAPASWSTTMG